MSDARRFLFLMLGLCAGWAICAALLPGGAL